ncbi:uncharacterized protein LOC134247442 [Saccostrea cucullata]|uniref:uncharacterized protein LOC134247442 n=1 Tax=Saccostrea cuccullata TaxID=36930 RepID=UPI002ED0BFBA
MFTMYHFFPILIFVARNAHTLVLQRGPCLFVRNETFIEGEFNNVTQICCSGSGKPPTKQKHRFVAVEKCLRGRTMIEFAVKKFLILKEVLFIPYQIYENPNVVDFKFTHHCRIIALMVCY